MGLDWPRPRGEAVALKSSSYNGFLFDISLSTLACCLINFQFCFYYFFKTGHRQLSLSISFCRKKRQMCKRHCSINQQKNLSASTQNLTNCIKRSALSYIQKFRKMSCWRLDESCCKGRIYDLFMSGAKVIIMCILWEDRQWIIGPLQSMIDKQVKRKSSN